MLSIDLTKITVNNIKMKIIKSLSQIMKMSLLVDKLRQYCIMKHMLYKINKMYNHTKSSARQIATEADLYEDLSLALLCFKQRLKNIVSKSNQYRHQMIQMKDDPQKNQDQTGLKLKNLISKYKKQDSLKPQFEIIIERFLIRMKEQLRQISVHAHKYKVDLAISIRKLQINIFKLFQQKSHSAAMNNIFSYIDNISIQYLLSQSHVASKKINKSPLTLNIKNYQSQHSSNSNSNTQSVDCKRKSQAEEFIRNAEKYSCIDIDIQYLRGRYFDLKEEERQFYNDSIARNHYIRNIITCFQKEYASGRQKLLESKPKFVTHPRQNRRTYHIVSSLQSSNTKQTNATFDSTFKLYKENTFFNNQISNQKIISQSSLQGKIPTETFRTAYQQKLRQRKTNAIKMKKVTVLITDQESPVCLNKINAKRLQFFKKSQEQTRLRYKYYNYTRKQAHSTNHFLKCKTANPQNMFTTLTYK